MALNSRCSSGWPGTLNLLSSSSQVLGYRSSLPWVAWARYFETLYHDVWEDHGCRKYVWGNRELSECTLVFCFEADKDRLKTSDVVLLACRTIWLGLVHSCLVEWEEPSVLGFYLGLPLEVCEDLFLLRFCSRKRWVVPRSRED